MRVMEQEQITTKSKSIKRDEKKAEKETQQWKKKGFYNGK
jgi:hypothetical protein